MENAFGPITRREALLLELQTTHNISTIDVVFLLDLMRPDTDRFIDDYYRHNRGEEMIDFHIFSDHLMLPVNNSIIAIFFGFHWPEERDLDQTFYALRFGMCVIGRLCDPGVRVMDGIEDDLAVFHLVWLILKIAVAAWEENNPVLLAD